MKRNILLFVLSISLSFLTAEYVGYLFDIFEPQTNASFWGPTKEGMVYFFGFILSYLVFETILIQLFGVNNKNKWLCITLLPVFIFFIVFDWKLMYIPFIIFALSYFMENLFIKIMNKLNKKINNYGK